MKKQQENGATWTDIKPNVIPAAESTLAASHPFMIAKGELNMHHMEHGKIGTRRNLLSRSHSNDDSQLSTQDVKRGRGSILGGDVCGNERGDMTPTRLMKEQGRS